MKKTNLFKLNLDVYEETLDNGLKVFVVPKSDVNNIYATFSTNYGSIQNEFIPIDGDDYIKVPDGVAHFLEHKVFEQKDGVDPFTFFSQTGTDCNANTSNYKTTYLFIGQTNLKANLNYLLDFVQGPYFTEENVRKEKGIIEQEINMYKDDPGMASYEKILYNSFINNPIRIPIGGTVESIYKITKEDLYNCYNTFYHPSNMFLVVTGNVDPIEVIDIVKENQSKKEFKKPNELKVKYPNEPDKVFKEKEEVNMNVTVPRVLIGYKFNIENNKFSTKKLLNYFGMFADLKFGPVSLFSEKLKEEKIITKDISYTTIKTDKHLLLLIEVETKEVDKLIKEIDNEIKLKNILEKDFNRKRKTAISSCIYTSDSIYKINNLIMNDIINDKKFNYEVYNHYKNLDFKEFSSLIENLNFDNKSILIVNPK